MIEETHEEKDATFWYESLSYPLMQDTDEHIAVKVIQDWGLECAEPTEFNRWLSLYRWQRRKKHEWEPLTLDLFCSEADRAWCAGKADAGLCVRVNKGLDKQQAS